MGPLLNRRAGSQVLGLFLWLPLVLGACALPVRPGCSQERSLPQQREVFLTVGIAAENIASSIIVDRSGRSVFNADYTVWMLSPPALCKVLPAEDVDRIERALVPLLEQPGQDSETPNFPYLLLVYTSSGEERSFFYNTTTTQSPERERALHVVLTALHRAYGSRFVRELRGAGLLSLLPDSPMSNKEIHR